MPLVHLFLNTLGASVRWCYGFLRRRLFNKPKYTFNEYLYGPKDSEDYFDQTAHQFNNKLIAILVIVGIVSVLFWSL